MEDNIEMDLQEVGCEGMDWIDLAQDRDRWWALRNVVVKLWSTGKCGGETLAYWKMREEATYCTFQRSHFGNSYGPVVRLNT